MYRLSLHLLLFSILCAGMPAASLSADAAGGEAASKLLPLAVVGGDTLTIGDLDTEILAAVAAAPEGAPFPPLEAEAVLKRLIENRLLEQEGLRIGADQLPGVENQVKDFIRLQSVKALMDSVSAPPPGAETRKEDEFLGMTGKMRRYAHILVKDQARARALRDSLSRGVPFADLARRHSIDGTAPRGGDLDWAAEGAYVEPFERAAQPLSVGEIAGPVETQFGWHLITLLGARTDTLKSEAMARAMKEAMEKERRTAAVRQYVVGLREKYGVKVNEALLESLDYGSADPQVQQQLQSSEEVLAEVPTGKLTVRGLTRNIRFKYFHGISGREDAEAIRDGMFDEWLTEALLTHEAHALGFDRDPALLRRADWARRRLVREEVLKEIVSFDFKPEDKEIRSFYQKHLDEYTGAPEVKVRSVLFEDEDAAGAFRRRLEDGAGFKWLADRAEKVVAGPPPFPTDWMDPAPLSLGDRPATEGAIVGPTALAVGWAVAQISAVKRAEPIPLEECRDLVIRAMKSVRTRKAIQDALEQLRKATRVEVPDGARPAVAERIEHWRAAAQEGGRP